jgi:peroxiredoxin
MAAAAALLVVVLTWPSLAADKPKIAPEADKPLHAMSDLYTSAKQLSVGIVADLTVKPTNDTMTTKTTLDFERPNRIAARAEGGLSFVCDGTTMNVFESVGNAYMVADAPKSLAAAAKGSLEKLALGQGLEFVAPLLEENPYDAILKDVTDVRYVGLEDLEGEKAHHLQLVLPEAEYDVWIDAGEKPLVRRIQLDITKIFAAKGIPEGVSIELASNFVDWNLAPKFDDKTFKFDPPEGAKKVATVDDVIDSLRAGPPHPLVGKPAPQAEFKLLSGGSVRVADHVGKDVVILEFWATWCPPCVAGLPSYAEIAADYKKKGVALYAVNLDENAETITDFLKEKKLDLPVGLDPGGRIAAEYGVEGIPHTAIIDKTGRIVAVHIGLAGDIKGQIGAELDELLKK